VRQIIPQDILRKYIMYAREKIKPKLYALDQEKLSGLFADLRRESMATGSYPITVRHLESMIRMAEASAKMALREYVRADDIDLAIEVAVGSFVSAQKISIKKTLQRVSVNSMSSIHLCSMRCGRDSENTSHRAKTTRSCLRSCSAAWLKIRPGSISCGATNSQSSSPSNCQSLRTE
jgi:DNA replicative helicase MCM subunit Mcm2 (Cdc46/Mcm family)